MGPVGLVEGLPDRGGDDGVLAAGHSPIDCTSSSTRRVETPPIQASWITATSAC
jgi:hypothetical protein